MTVLPAVTEFTLGDTMLSIKKVVFFGGHADDEMICAGTLHRLVQQGCEVHVISFAPAATEHDRLGTQVSSNIVWPEWNKALDIIGVKSDHRQFLNFNPSVDLTPFSQQICQYAFDFCEREKPDAAFILSPEDENTAHAIVGTECERVLRGRVPIAIRCQFPWNFSIGRPNLYVSLSERDMIAKIKVIDAYESQKFRYRYGPMLLNYCHADGLSVKGHAAEKFELLRCVL